MDSGFRCDGCTFVSKKGTSQGMSVFSERFPFSSADCWNTCLADFLCRDDACRAGHSTGKVCRTGI